jgi:hypothetical protein
MKKSDVYEIAIKLLGIYLFINHLSAIFTSIFQLIQTISFTAMGNGGQSPVLVIVYVLFEILIILFSLLLIFKTKYVAGKISSPDDYEENATLFAERKAIYEIALIIIGGITIIWALPDFVDRLYWFMYFKRNQFAVRSLDEEIIVTTSIKLFLGVVSVVYAKPIAAYFDRSTIVTTKSEG